MFQHFYSLICAALLAVVATKVFSFWKSLAQARRFAAASPLPFVTIYWFRESGLFWLLSPWFAPFIERLPFGLGHWVRYKKRDFSWAHKGKIPREELGSDVYWTAAPGGCLLHVSDADVISQIVHRWRDFPKPIFYYHDLAYFGPNVVTTEGAAWQRHRRITGPSFNERNSGLVFQESMSQAKAMLASFTHEADGIPSIPGKEPIVDDLLFWLKTIALKVLSGAAFNINIPWTTQSIVSSDKVLDEQKDGSSVPPGKHLMSWQHSMNTIMEYFYFLVILPTSVLENSPWKFMRDVQVASDQFVSYMLELVTDAPSPDDTLTPAAGDTKTNLHKRDVLSNIIRANKTDQNLALDDEEIFGNIFILIIAGHETTASTLETALILLATEPEFQQSIQDEIDSIWASKKAGEELSYEDYPKMRTIMALMLETLRLYPPIINLFKSTSTPQTLTYRSQAIPIPANTTIFLEAVSTHRNPLYWSPSPDLFLPSRWLKPPSYTPPLNTVSESPAHAHLLCPQKGSFIAFGAGMRNCLGKKFAQVEFCTVIAALLRGWSVELVSEGMGWEEKKSETLGMLDDRSTVIALRMKGKVKVRFVRRGYETFPPRKGRAEGSV